MTRFDAPGKSNQEMEGGWRAIPSLRAPACFQLHSNNLSRSTGHFATRPNLFHDFPLRSLELSGAFQEVGVFMSVASLCYAVCLGFRIPEWRYSQSAVRAARTRAAASKSLPAATLVARRCRLGSVGVAETKLTSRYRYRLRTISSVGRYCTASGERRRCRHRHFALLLFASF